MDDKPSQALRNGRWKSSMWLAIDAVKKGEADVAVSAGNTGALMAMAKFNLRMHAGHRAPGDRRRSGRRCKGDSIVLDLGASIGADAEHLVDMAVMGSAMARVLFDLDRPTVGLLNIGVEEVKGLEPVREAGRILREEPLPHIEYIGFVEGDDIGKGKVDVVVTEGFAGNIALKTAEGTARQFADYLRERDDRTSVAPSSAICWRAPAFRMLRDKMDPRKSNGGVFLGLNGVVIKSHGGTDPEGFAAAIDVGYDMVRYELLGKIGETDPPREHRRREPRARARARPPAERPRDHVAFGHPRMRQLSAGARSHQRGTGRHRRHLRRMDRAAHRHPPAPHRRGRAR